MPGVYSITIYISALSPFGKFILYNIQTLFLNFITASVSIWFAMASKSSTGITSRQFVTILRKFDKEGKSVTNKTIQADVLSLKTVLIFLFTDLVSLIKSIGNGNINISELDAFLKAFEDEVFNTVLKNYIQATPLT